MTSSDNQTTIKLIAAAWWLVILSGPNGKAIAPLLPTQAECEAAKAWVVKHPAYDAVCLPAGVTK